MSEQWSCFACESCGEVLPVQELTNYQINVVHALCLECNKRFSPIQQRFSTFQQSPDRPGVESIEVDEELLQGKRYHLQKNDTKKSLSRVILCPVQELNYDSTPSALSATSSTTSSTQAPSTTRRQANTSSGSNAAIPTSAKNLTSSTTACQKGSGASDAIKKNFSTAHSYSTTSHTKKKLLSLLEIQDKQAQRNMHTSRQKWKS